MDPNLVKMAEAFKTDLVRGRVQKEQGRRQVIGHAYDYLLTTIGSDRIDQVTRERDEFEVLIKETINGVLRQKA